MPPSTAPLSDNDRQALKEIYSAIVGFDVEINKKGSNQACRGEDGKVVMYAHFKTDENGRVTYLNLRRIDGEFFNLPAAVGKLEFLEELFLRSCKSLVIELSSLTHLKKLNMIKCHHLFQDVSLLSEISLPQLTYLYIYNSRLTNDINVPGCIFSWIQEKLPRLKSLLVRGSRGQRTRRVWDPSDLHIKTGLSNHNCLKSIKIEEWYMQESELEILLFDVLPSFPKVSMLSLPNNKIASFQSIHKRLERTPSNFPLRSSLLTLVIAKNPILNNLTTQTQELCGVLRAFNAFIPTYSCSRRFLDLQPAVVKGQLIFNFAGINSLINNKNGYPFLSSIMCPILMARINQLQQIDNRFETQDTASAMYLFLREGPLLNRNAWTVPVVSKIFPNTNDT